MSVWCCGPTVVTGFVAPTCFPLADDEAGVIKHLLLVVVADHLALPEVGREPGGLNH